VFVFCVFCVCYSFLFIGAGSDVGRVKEKYNLGNSCLLVERCMAGAITFIRHTDSSMPIELLNNFYKKIFFSY